jgi:hypothetical protein
MKADQLADWLGEPSWEPFSVDSTGRAWAPVNSDACTTRPNRHTWTSVDAAWPSTDQKVGGSSPPERADRNPAQVGVSACQLSLPCRRPCRGSILGSHSEVPSGHQRAEVVGGMVDVSLGIFSLPTRRLGVRVPPSVLRKTW